MDTGIETPYRVQMWPDGPEKKPQYEKYQTVYVRSPKEAAEKLYGGPLREEGSNSQLRAQVLITSMGRITKILFMQGDGSTGAIVRKNYREATV